MCIDFHANSAHLLCAGFYDGTVAVYDLRKNSQLDKRFCVKSTSGYHLDPVWKVGNYFKKATKKQQKTPKMCRSIGIFLLI
jgi:WD40 repeat protein